MPRRPANLAFVALFLGACAATGSPVTTASITPTAISRATASPVPATAPLATIRSTPTFGPVTPSPMVAPTPSPSPSKRPWSVVVVGDSIAYNHPKDCLGCTGVADRYAAAIERATGRDVALTNLSEYTGLRVEGLRVELRSDAARRSAIAGADFVLITIAHNNVVCPDWDLGRTACATLADQHRETYAQVFAAVVALRAGRATAFRTVNRYNDVTKPGTTAGEAAGSKLILDAWNEMVCRGNGEGLPLRRHLSLVQWAGRPDAIRRPAGERLHPPVGPRGRAHRAHPGRSRICATLAVTDHPDRGR